ATDGSRRPTAAQEEQVGAPIQLDHDDRWDLDIMLESDHAALSASTSRAGDVEDGALATAAGNDERLEWFELLIAVVDRVLEILDAPLVDVRLDQVVVHFVEIGRRQQRADTKEIPLDGDQNFVDAGHR